MVRDDEIKRLIKYAEALGCKVTFKKVKTGDDAAHWLTDGTEIIVYVQAKYSKTYIITCLIHEIAHHLAFIHNENRQIDEDLYNAIDDPKRRSRKKVLDWELLGMNYWDLIYKEVNLTFPIRKLHKEKELDTWFYTKFYEDGDYPSKKEIKAKMKELSKKYDKI